MADRTHTVAADEVGVHEITLTPSAIETFKFPVDLPSVDVISNGAAALYYTLNGTDPTIAGKHCYVIPAMAAIDTRQVLGDATINATTVKVISSGSPMISVQRGD